MSKEIVTVLAGLVESGHTIISCDFSTGEVVFRVGQVSPEALVEGKVLHLLRKDGGRPLPAIKLYRELTGLGLGDAKRKVEALMERHGIEATYGPNEDW